MNNIAKASDTPVTVRFPRKTHKELKKLAKKNGRSFNSEVVARLNGSLLGVETT